MKPRACAVVGAARGARLARVCGVTGQRGAEGVDEGDDEVRGGDAAEGWGRTAAVAGMRRLQLC